jgi:hypothetical protein
MEHATTAIAETVLTAEEAARIAQEARLARYERHVPTLSLIVSKINDAARKGGTAAYIPTPRLYLVADDNYRSQALIDTLTVLDDAGYRTLNAKRYVADCATTYIIGELLYVDEHGDDPQDERDDGLYFVVSWSGATAAIYQYNSGANNATPEEWRG